MDLSNLSIQDMENKAMEIRKTVICRKMEVYYEYVGINGGDLFMEYLKENCNFKYGDVIDFENFKKDYLTNTFRLSEFNKIFLNSGLDYDDFVYLGFNNDLKVVTHEELYFAFYDAIKDYEFSNEDLTLFEEFVDFHYYKAL